MNGELSEPYAMEKGVPQGDPLSCLLFNLYIDSLSRYLKSRPDLQGVSAFGGGISLLHLLYADDLIGFAESASELQRILSYVEQWSAAWGMKLNTGVGKTEAMLVDTEDLAPLPAALPLHLSDGRLVLWTARYRYLGYYLRSDLRDDDAVAFLFSHLDYLWNSHFIHNGLVRHASAAFQTQFYSTMVQGSLRHLRALTSISSADAVKLDAVLLRHIRKIFDLERGRHQSIWCPLLEPCSRGTPCTHRSTSASTSSCVSLVIPSRFQLVCLDSPKRTLRWVWL